MEELLQQQNEIVLLMVICGLIVLAALWYLQLTQRQDARSLTKDNSLIAFIAIATVGVAVRFVLAYNMPGYQSDMDCFRAWARDAYAGGLDHFYDGDFFADYPPLYVYVLYFFGWIQSAAGLDIMGGSYAVILRLPSIIAEVVMAWIVYHLTEKRGSRSTALVLGSLILLNPAVMLNSSVWGQIDSLATLMLIGVVWLLYRRRIVAASALFMLSFLLKPQAVMIAPLLLFVYVYELVKSSEKLRTAGRIAAACALMIAMWFIVPLPFGIGRDPMWLAERYMTTIGEYAQASLNALNVYSLFGLNFLDAAEYSFLGMPLPVWGYVFVGLSCAWAVYLFWKRPSGWFLFAIGGGLVYAVYILTHGMHERYVYPVPFLLLMAYILCRDRRLLDCSVLSFVTVMLGEALSLYYYGQWIPAPLITTCSALSVAFFGYTAYVLTSVAVRGPQKQPLPERDETPAPERSERVAARLERPLGCQKCDRKDVLIMAVISALYAVVAFTNLGTFDIPQTSAVIADEAVIEFPEPEHITTFKYYAGYGEGAFDVLYSEDGQNYEYADMTASDFQGFEIVHQLGNLYKWQVYTLDIEARSIKLVSVGQDLPILEVGFFGPEGNQIVPSQVMMAGEAVTAWTDEQTMVPYEPTYLTDFYFDEIYHVRTAYENIHGITPYEITHPPLGKIIIALGIQIFGMNSIGWRIMGTLAGVLMLPVMYVLARMLFRKRKYAVYAATLLAVDGMHYAQTRIGTVDSYSILWIMLMYLFMYRYAMTDFNRQPLRRTLVPLFWCGLFFGIGAATKWLCLYAGFGLLVIYVFLMVRRHQEYVYARDTETYPEIVEGYRRKMTATLLWSVLFFILIPAAIYIASYTPYMLVTDGGAYDFAAILGNQSYMLNYHAYLNPDHVHPFASKWYTWPADVRPVLFFSNQTDDTIATLSTMGNPFLWWVGIAAVVSLLLWALRSRRERTFVLFFLGIGALAEYAPWWFITREVFIYHYFAVVPFLVLLIVLWLKDIEERYRWGRTFGYWIVGICMGFFAAFYPVITGVPAPRDYINGIRWLTSWPFY
ncbi:MAG: phospholipid carrier-dependent glycosyltransferase [Clostridia bacterium]|nr:phospholipid carrier-dependent glycosyltransferase [Clostridia bacterium]